MNIHFSGVGGIGMSALARYFLAQGFQVTGSDSSESDLTDELEIEGLIWIDAMQEVPQSANLHIYTEAVHETDIQRVSAEKYGIKSLSYFQALGELSQKFKTLAVCGTHGKSTCTAMTGIALGNTCIDPLVIVGTKVKEFGAKNIRMPKDILSFDLTQGKRAQNDKPYCIVEACEYRGSFLALSPFGVVLTNCELDHMDYYKSEEEYIQNFQKFVSKIPKEGFLIANFDDENVQKVAKSAKCKLVPVQLSKIQSPISPKVPGWHNQLNAELAFAACKELISQEDKGAVGQVQSALQSFSGTWRRFDILGEKNEVTVIDDYAHHPTEIRATLKALREYANTRRFVLVFQPHQYSRTRELFDDFVESFADNLPQGAVLFITDIYEARDTEEDKKAVSSQKLVDALSVKGVNACCSGGYNQTLKNLKEILKEKDILITMGAGPVNLLAEKFLEIKC